MLLFIALLSIIAPEYLLLVLRVIAYCHSQLCFIVCLLRSYRNELSVSELLQW